MALNSNPYINYNNLYFTYKAEENKAFENLFPKQKYREWTLKHLYAETASMIPSLGKDQRESIINSLEKSMEARKKYSLLFHDAPPQRQLRHAKFVDLLKIMIDLLKAAALSETEAPKGAVPQQEEALEDVSVNEAAFLRFLEDIELLVGQAVALWPRAAAGGLRLSTASKLTSTYLCKIKTIVSAESLLNESWFESGGLVAIYKSGHSSYWDELQSCAPQLGEFYVNAVFPIFKSGLPYDYMPFVTEMLSKGAGAVQKDGNFITFSTAIAASFVHRCNRLDLDLNKLRTSVNKRILETAELLQKLKSRFSFANNFDECLSLIPKFEIWADRCGDAVSFGEMMSWLEVQLVLGRRYFIHENAAFQLFAYICERVRIRGRRLPATLEALFNDPRVAPFLFMDGRPGTLDACRQGIERWSDPSSVRPVTPHVYNVRNRPTLTEQITERKGAVTLGMVQQLGGATLEQYLEWELDFTDPIRLEDSLARAARSVAKADLIDYVDCWYYLRKEVLNRPVLEEKLLEVFMEQWAPEVRDEGPVESSVVVNNLSSSLLSISLIDKIDID